MHYDDVWAERKSKKEPLYDRIKDRESLITFWGWERVSTNELSHDVWTWKNESKKSVKYQKRHPTPYLFKYLFVSGQTRQDMMENKAAQDKLVESGSKSLEEHREEFDWLKG